MGNSLTKIYTASVWVWWMSSAGLALALSLAVFGIVRGSLALTAFRCLGNSESPFAKGVDGVCS
jgi:hypothetical protein